MVVVLSADERALSATRAMRSEFMAKAEGCGFDGDGWTVANLNGPFSATFGNTALAVGEVLSAEACRPVQARTNSMGPCAGLFDIT
jgi:hypothetical protein